MYAPPFLPLNAEKGNHNRTVRLARRKRHKRTGHPADAYAHRERPALFLHKRKITEKLKKYGAVNDTGRAFDPLALKPALEELCTEAGVKLLYHTFIFDVIKENGAITAVVAANKAGAVAISGKVFIDCTGDGDVSVLAGAEYTKGNPETGKNQPISLRYIVSGVDIPKLGEFFMSEVKRTGIANGCSYTPPLSIYGAVCGDGSTLSELFKKAIAAGDLTVEDHLYWQMFTVPGRNDAIAFNNPEFLTTSTAQIPILSQKRRWRARKQYSASSPSIKNI